uniref:Uncharacterized protein n=1 Tax=Rhizophora mucronata TaxID=61149 RepID=A0A2P2J941_RHIMU
MNKQCKSSTSKHTNLGSCKVLLQQIIKRITKNFHRKQDKI